MAPATGGIGGVGIFAQIAILVMTKRPPNWWKRSGCASTPAIVGYIQLGFVHQGLVFLHETTTEWYERFQMLLEEIEASRTSSSTTPMARDDEDE